MGAPRTAKTTTTTKTGTMPARTRSSGTARPRTGPSASVARGGGKRRHEPAGVEPQQAPAVVIAADGNDVGADPHKHTVTASVLDPRGGVLGTASFKVSGEGHRALDAWAASFGPVRRWGIEGASGLGRHTAMYLIRAGHDVRDVCPNRTNERDRARRRGKSDAIDSVKIAREVQAHPDLPVAFKRAAGDAGPDETTECLSLWHQARRSLLKSRQHLLNEAEALLVALPEDIRAQLPGTSEVRPRLGPSPGSRGPGSPTGPPGCASACWKPTGPTSPSWTGERPRSPTSWPGWSRRPAPAWAACAGSRIAPTPSCWSKSATPAASPAKPASPASTAPPPCPPPRPKATASPPATGSTEAATGGSTPSYTAWPSPNCNTNPGPGPSTTTPAPGVTPKKRPCASSSATCPTWSTDR